MKKYKPRQPNCKKCGEQKETYYMDQGYRHYYCAPCKLMSCKIKRAQKRKEKGLSEFGVLRVGHCSVESCNGKIVAKKLCRKHYTRLYNHGDVNANLMNDLIISKENFHMQTEQVTESGCWIWMRSLDCDGYGRLSYDNKQIKAHRLAHILFKGAVANEELVCHTCDVPSCVNPAHLFIGTHQTNQADKIKKSRQAKGSKSGNSILNEDVVKQIKFALMSKEKISALAKKYKVSELTIQRIKNDKLWRHVILDKVGIH